MALLLAANRWRSDLSDRGTAGGAGAPANSLRWITGRVVDRQQAISGARVRWKGTLEFTTTDAAGRFRLPAAQSSLPLTAWKEGYLIGSAAAARDDVTIELVPLPRVDNADYAWVDPTPNGAQPQNCGNCHPEIYDQWQHGGHAHSATNPRFLDLYGDGDGDAKRGSHGQWNLLAELPHGAAVCGSCHAPSLEFDDPASEDMRLVEGTSARGVHCDFCHKVRDVSAEQLGLSHGRFGMRLLRPRQGQLFFGPLEDVDRGEDTFSHVQRESRYCAACHEGILFGVHVYQTWSEWQASPARRQGLECQSCHMAPDGHLANIAPNMGGIDRDPRSLANHDLFPGGQLAMLRRALAMDIRVERGQDEVECRVELMARGVGHRVPTGFVDRHLILVVEAFDSAGDLLSPAEGNQLPAAAGDVAGQAGKLFGRWLHDEKGHGPVPFWRAAGEGADTRLQPERAEFMTFAFPEAATRLRVRLIYRRFWQEVAQAKGWLDDALVVFDREVAAKHDDQECYDY
jgi:hypothetical protein